MGEWGKWHHLSHVKHVVGISNKSWISVTNFYVALKDYREKYEIFMPC